MSTETETISADEVRIPGRLRAYLNQEGTVKGANLVVPLAVLDEITAGPRGAGGGRVSHVDEHFAEVLPHAQPMTNAEGEELSTTFIPWSVLSEAGFNQTCVTDRSYWSGSNRKGTRVAAEAGFKVKQSFSLEDPAGAGLILVPITDEQKAKILARCDKADAKAAAKRTADSQ